MEYRPDRPARRRLAVKGWHPERAAEIVIGSPAEVANARRIIAAETAAIAARGEAIEARLATNERSRAAVEASKTRHRFNLETADIPDKPLGQWRRKYDREAEAPQHWFVPEEKRPHEWLAERYISGGAFLAVGALDRLDASFISKGGFGLERALPGEGEVIRSFSGNPDRYRPQWKSFAHWLSRTPLKERQRFVGYILGSGAGLLDCRLLARRLHRHQIVCAHPRSEAARHLRSVWQGSIFEWPELMICATPGLRYLDPVLLTPEEDARIDWPKVSVVTVSFNQAQFLEECLESVLGQRYPNMEYIVVDGGSTDGSADILRRYETRLSRLIIEPDEGQSDGLNKGFDLATGEILTWINSDDMLMPGALRRGVLAMLDHDSDLVTGGCRRITDQPGETLLEHQPAIPYGRSVPLGFLEQFMWATSWEKGDYFFQPEVLFSSEAWQRSGGFLKLHLYWAMDWELWIRMALAGATISHVPEMVGCSRAHPQQKTVSDERYIYQLLNILHEHADLLDVLPGNLADAKVPDELPGWLQLADVRREGRERRTITDILRRLPELRDPARLRAAMRSRAPGGMLLLWRGYRQWRMRHRMAGIVPAQLQSARQPAEEPDRYEQFWAIADLFTRLLFSEEKSHPAAKEIVGQTIEAGGDLFDALRQIAIHFPELQGRPSFAVVRQLLHAKADLPADLGRGIYNGSFTIVDIGAEPLANENHVYARLLASRPTRVIAFDPMDREAPRTVHKRGEEGRPSSEVRILPDFVLDGAPATFHLARMQATSSTLPANSRLAGRFSLLAEAVEAVETRPVPTSRLDDILAAQELCTAAIDFLKIDVQGATMPVLKGAPEALARTLVCHLEVEFAPLYESEELFGAVDRHMQAAGFALLDLATIGRQRYKAFDRSDERIFHAGRILWADCVYVRHLDEPERLSDEELLRLAEIAHLVYGKQDVAAFALQEIATRRNSTILADYLSLLRGREQHQEALVRDPIG